MYIDVHPRINADLRIVCTSVLFVFVHERDTEGQKVQRPLLPNANALLCTKCMMAGGINYVAVRAVMLSDSFSAHLLTLCFIDSFSNLPAVFRVHADQLSKGNPSVSLCDVCTTVVCM